MPPAGAFDLRRVRARGIQGQTHHEAVLVQSELVISTYQKPGYLALVLTTLLAQRRKPDSLCIADDGSDDRTRSVIAAFRAICPDLALRHVWQDDRGFRKTLILNEALRTSAAEYMVFIDDDCLMHPGYIERHLHLAARGQFLTGSVIRLKDALTQRLLTQGHLDWTAQHRPPGWTPRGLSEWLKSMPFPAPVMGVLDRLSPVRCSWAGGNASTFRDHMLAVNGFDSRMAYGGEDKEFGARLINAGIKGRHLRYSAPLYHLEHGRGYVDPKVRHANRDILLDTRTTGRVRTDHGLAP